MPELSDDTTSEEMSVLTSAFKQMTRSIKQYISDLNEKMDVIATLLSSLMRERKVGLWRFRITIIVFI